MCTTGIERTAYSLGLGVNAFAQTPLASQRNISADAVKPVHDLVVHQGRRLPWRPGVPENETSLVCRWPWLLCRRALQAPMCPSLSGTCWSGLVWCHCSFGKMDLPTASYSLSSTEYSCTAYWSHFFSLIGPFLPVLDRGSAKGRGKHHARVSQLLVCAWQPCNVGLA